MKYLVVGNIALLASRGIEKISSDIGVEVKGVPDGATLYIQQANGEMHLYGITSERAVISFADLTEGKYSVSINWVTNENGLPQTHEAAGNPFTVYNADSGELAITPTQLSTATELEQMWSGIVNALEILIPFIDDYKNGPNVI
ncbi:MAG: hypothetical protein J6U86_04215 [Clostridia bacterium]|nr:hypothetical protein [Clostridia bacterium]